MCAVISILTDKLIQEYIYLYRIYLRLEIYVYVNSYVYTIK